jgi:malate dehydrogenase
MVVWGNHSATQYPDISFASIEGQAATAKTDQQWYVKEFIPTVQQRGAAIIKTRGASSAASAASAAIDHMRDWALGSDGKWVSMGVYSAGNPYGINPDIIYSFPITCDRGEWTVVSDLKISDFSRERMQITEKELLDEKSAVADLI